MATVQPGGEEWVKTCEKVGGDDQELVRKLLKVGRSAGRREHGEETSDAHGEGAGGEVSEADLHDE